MKLKADLPHIREMLSELCLGEPAAIQFCAVFLNWCHWLDDVIDRDAEYTPEFVVRLNLETLMVFSDNPFFLKHRQSLMPLIIQAARAAGDSLEWAKRERLRDRQASDVMKSQYHEVFWHVGYLVATQAGRNGWQHSREMTRKYRAFDYDIQ